MSHTQSNEGFAQADFIGLQLNFSPVVLGTKKRIQKPIHCRVLPGDQSVTGERLCRHLRRHH